MDRTLAHLDECFYEFKKGVQEIYSEQAGMKKNTTMFFSHVCDESIKDIGEMIDILDSDIDNIKRMLEDYRKEFEKLMK